MTNSTMSKPPLITNIDEDIAGVQIIANHNNKPGKETYNWANDKMLTPEMRVVYDQFQKVEEKTNASEWPEKQKNQVNKMNSEFFVSLVSGFEFRFTSTMQWKLITNQRFEAGTQIPPNAIRTTIGESETSISNFASELGLEVGMSAGFGFANISANISAKISASFGKEVQIHSATQNDIYLPIFEADTDCRILIWKRETVYQLQSRYGKNEFIDVKGAILVDNSITNYTQIFPKHAT